MRVISGKAKGTKLNSIESISTRPTLDRIKEAFFNIIQPSINEEALVLDLFAGSGQIGIEFLSRGCKKSFFCEKNPLSVKMIKQNLDKTKLTQDSKIINKDYKKALEYFKDTKTQFNIIYIDPPYKLDIAIESVKFIMNNEILSENGIIVIETDDEQREIEELKNIDTEIYDLRKYGRVRLIFLRRKGKE